MDGLDQFSKLPMPILQHILSFLIVKDAAKTSVLSKTWNSAWSSLSCLNFGDIVFMKSKNVLDQILANRQKQNISIQRLKAKVLDRWLMFLDNWIKILVAGNIKDLHLEVFTSTHNKLPEAIFAAKALNVLRLGGFKLELPSDGIKFSSLRELHLIKSFLDEQVLEALCASCSHLEVLSFREFRGLACFQIAGTLPKLRIVYLVDCLKLLQRVDITAPDLKHLHIISSELNVINITACKSLTNLNLSSVAVTDQWLDNLLPNLPNLELFYLSSCSSLKSLKISSDRLKYFKVVRCNNLIAVDLDTPYLLEFSSDFRYCRKVFQGDIDLLPTFKLKASHLLEVNLKLILETPIDTHWYSTLTKYLENFNNVKAIALSCDDHKVIVIPKHMRENLLPLLYGTRLHVKINNLLTHSAMVDVLESLFWVSPQLGSLSFGKIIDYRTLKFTYRDRTDEAEKPCCAYVPWKCWRHELNKVNLQHFTCMELPKLRNYFLTNTDVLEIIEDPPGCCLCNSNYGCIE